ncbi:hypothetical protein [Tsukamurella spumae]|uniref:Uncharacterized protein n=1 Tax=Tsukamurella spumae TaxID=44753 RepID=A0A846X175_9ACTN|nr:hypothetical protein [Tsukamurella spumae]NKY18861.1 hypothetical protein [Tsukamurella spumae]
MASPYEANTQRILRLLRQTFEGEGEFKEFYDGDPDQIPAFNLPCIVVDQTNEDTEAAAFGQDDTTDRLVIKVIYNKADDYASGINPNNLTSRKIRRVIGERDPDSGQYLPNTIKHALRHTGTEGITAIGSDLAIEYGQVPRLNGDKGIWTQEGHVRFSVQYSTDVVELP